MRGGRFVTGFSCEQFAHPEAVAARINGEIRILATLRADEERRYGQLLTQERKGRKGAGHRQRVGRGW